MKRTLSVAMVFILVFFSAQSVFASTEDANIEEHLVTPVFGKLNFHSLATNFLIVA